MIHYGNTICWLFGWQKAGAAPGFNKGAGQARGARACNGGLGWSAKWDLGAKPLVSWSGRAKPPEAESLVYTFIQERGHKLRI